MVRNPGKYKTKRGGGRNFSRTFTLDENGTAVGTERRRGDAKDGDEDEESGEDEEGEEEDEEEGDEDEGPELTRIERRELKKKQATEHTGKQDEAADADGDDDLMVNPNRAMKKLNISDLSAPRQLTRREREQKEKQEAKERYWKLHVQGKTDEAKADLSRLAKIRAEREAVAAKRKAEAEEKARLAAAKAAAQSSRR